MGAKLNRVGQRPVGEGGAFMLDRSGLMPNDEFALYTEGDFRLRVLTSGGLSPDGMTGLRPTMFEQFFRLHVRGADGQTVIMDKVGLDYQVAGGSLRLVGLSDLEPVVIALDDPMRVSRGATLSIRTLAQVLRP